MCYIAATGSYCRGCSEPYSGHCSIHRWVRLLLQMLLLRAERGTASQEHKCWGRESQYAWIVKPVCASGHGWRIAGIPSGIARPSAATCVAAPGSRTSAAGRVVCSYRSDHISHVLRAHERQNTVGGSESSRQQQLKRMPRATRGTACDAEREWTRAGLSADGVHGRKIWALCSILLAWPCSAETRKERGKEGWGMSTVRRWERGIVPGVAKRREYKLDQFMSSCTTT